MSPKRRRTSIALWRGWKLYFWKETFLHFTRFNFVESINSARNVCPIDINPLVRCFFVSSYFWQSVKEFRLFIISSHTKKKLTHELIDAARFVCKQILRRKFMPCVFVWPEPKWNISLLFSLAVALLLCIHSQTHVHTIIVICVLYCDKASICLCLGECDTRIVNNHHSYAR